MRRVRIEKQAVTGFQPVELVAMSVSNALSVKLVHLDTLE